MGVTFNLLPNQTSVLYTADYTLMAGVTSRSTAGNNRYEGDRRLKTGGPSSFAPFA